MLCRNCVTKSLRPIAKRELVRAFQYRATWLSRGLATSSRRHADFASLSVDKLETPSDVEHNVAVIGGGITGLSTAWWLTRKYPKSKVTIYTPEERLGGWLQSEEVQVQDGKVFFERGPRTLRLAGSTYYVTLAMVEMLGLTDQLIVTPKTAPAAKNRYIYYPDQLVKMPSREDGFAANIWKVLTEPVFKGVIWGILNEVRVPPRDDDVLDESVGSFLSRRLGTQPAENLASAMMHGIYAGNIWQLSAKMLLGRFWKMEEDYGSLLNAVPRSYQNGALLEPRELSISTRFQLSEDMLSATRFGSVFSFKRGLQQFSDALVDRLRNSPNVTIRAGSPVTKIVPGDSRQNGAISDIKITAHGDSQPTLHTHAISTIFSRTLATLASSPETPSQSLLPSLSHTNASTVMVINLYFSEPHLIDHKGFGYLIPLSVPSEQNPERALGVIFDSDAVTGQDTVSTPGTKLTVMMGGHYWQNWPSYPSEEEGIEMAMRLLRRHLGPLPDPEVARATLQKDCIPQYTVGHYERMGQAHSELQSAFKGRLRVAGNSYNGVGVHDCTAAGMEVVDSLEMRSATGLESFAQEKKWLKMRIEELTKVVREQDRRLYDEREKRRGDGKE